MHLSLLNLVNFKNYSEASIQLSSGVNCFTGNNGSGKTNILDAVHYLSMSKSYFTAGDVQNIKNNMPLCVIQGDFILNEKTEHVFCSIRRDQKKIFKHNSEEYARLSEHIGMFPVVMIAPQDHDLILEGSDIRRKFIDSIISQVNHPYLNDLISYNRFLVQRNALLKQCSNSGNADYSLFEFYDMKIASLGKNIYNIRNSFFEEFETMFKSNFNFMTSGNEDVQLLYFSHLQKEHPTDLLKSNFNKDLDMQYTTTGIHKDDLEFQINGMNLKKFGSQGQQKTYVTALKLAQYEYMKQHKNLKPIVLLDDIYDKLDDERVSKLMQLVSEDKFGQLLITDTNKDRIKNIFEKINVPLKSFEVSAGVIK